MKKKEEKELLTLDPGDPLFEKTVRKLVEYHLRHKGLDSTETADLQQNVVLNILQMEESKRKEVEAPTAFLFVVAKNAINKYLAQRLSTPEIQIAEPEDQDAEFQSNYAKNSQADYDADLLLREFREILNVSERDILTLLTFGYKQNEIALRLGISHDSARQKVHRLRTKLRAFLDYSDEHSKKY